MEKGRFWARNEKEMCPGGATCLPMLGNVLAPLGQAACPKMDKTRLKATVNGEEWQVSEAGTIATRNYYISGDIVPIGMWRWTRD